jgi:hypothetical protein
MSGPNTSSVSTNPGVMRGGASGKTTWIASPASVTTANQVRIIAYAARRRTNTHSRKAIVAGKWTAT